MTKLETLLANAHAALNHDNENWPPSPQTVIDAFDEIALEYDVSLGQALELLAKYRQELES
jgi:hypothetical protein